MKVALLLMTDGREEYRRQSWHSAVQHLEGIDVVVINEDEPTSKLGRLPNGWAYGREWPQCLLKTQTRLGFGGAIRNAWDHLERDHKDVTHVFHLEADMVFNGPVPVREMCELLDRHPNLAQVALRRQAWNEEELAAGGVVEAHPTEFHSHTDQGADWLAHRLFFTTNPCVYRVELLKVGWPRGDFSEGRFTYDLLQDGLPWGVEGKDVEFAYWGRREDPPAVHHIGEKRAGHGY